MGRQRIFAYRIWVTDSDGETHEFQAGDPAPGWAIKAITNPKALVDGDYDVEETPPTPAAPTTPVAPVVPVASAAPAAGTDPGTGGSDGDGAPPVVLAPDYSALKKGELQAEVEKRNTGREDDDLIVVEGTGKISDLVAALQADDVAQSDTDN